MKINLNKQLIRLILEAKDGAWDIDMQASTEARNLLNASARENFEKNPFQYFTNWYIRGPFTHLTSEAYGKIAELFYSLLKNTESKPITTVEQFRKELKDLEGPWNKEKEALLKGFEIKDKALTTIKNKHFMQWVLNPFVKGDLHSKINYKLKEDLILELNHYGDGKNTSNEAMLDNTRQIEHKRALDKIVKNQKLEENSVIQQPIILPNYNKTEVYNTSNPIKEDYLNLRATQKQHEKNLKTVSQLGGMIGGLGGGLGGANAGNYMVDTGYTDTFEPLVPMVSAGLGGLAGGLIAPMYYNSISIDNKKIKDLDNRIRQQLN